MFTSGPPREENNVVSKGKMLKLREIRFFFGGGGRGFLTKGQTMPYDA